MITVYEIQRWAPVVDAVEHRRRVRLLEKGEVVSGTLRGFTPDKDDSSHARNTADLDQLWVRITTEGGWDMWIKALVLCERHADGAVAFG